MNYSVYGLKIKSNASIPGLKQVIPARKADVLISMQQLPDWLNETVVASAEPWYCSEDRIRPGMPNLKVSRLLNGAFYHFCYQDGTTFVVDHLGSQIWAAWPEKMTLEDTATYLLGPMLGFVLRLRGILCLHASAIAVGEQAIAMVGRAGAGKSTTVAAFARRGFSVISEDVLPLVELGSSFWAQPGYPCIRLWPKSVAILFGAPDRLPQLAPPWEKCYLSLGENGYHLHPKAVPLAALYLLSPRADLPEAPLVDVLTPRAGVIELVTNTYANYLLDGMRRANELKALSRLATSVNLRKVVPHTDPAKLDRLCDLILDDFQGVRDSRSASSKG